MMDHSGWMFGRLWFWTVVAVLAAELLLIISNMTDK